MDIIQSRDEILEIPVSELQALFNSSVALFNDILDDCSGRSDSWRRRSSAEMTNQCSKALSKTKNRLYRSLFCSMSS